MFAAANAAHAESAAAIRQTELYWLAVATVVLFATHLARMRSADTWLGLVSPFVATAGDFIMAVLLGGLLVAAAAARVAAAVAPARAKSLATAPRAERTPGCTRCRAVSFESGPMSACLLPARCATHACRWRSAAGVVLRLGLPLAVLLAAMNTIWGFTWYFNTESWASAFYQKVTELRVDTWRAAMVDRIRSAYRGKDDDLFRVTPPGIEDGDFSFIVIGDPGEGDTSQYALVDRYLDIGRRDDVKFLVIASDVIYPAGAMEDYENNFYMPFKGFTKPIYAIPGNHDWFDALEGFNANFLEPKAARAALTARVEADLHLTSTNRSRIDRLLDQARRLRELYGIRIAGQRGPFFEIQTSDFALIAIDTGIRRTIDARQRAWLAEALERARGKFMIVIRRPSEIRGGRGYQRRRRGVRRVPCRPRTRGRRCR